MSLKLPIDSDDTNVGTYRKILAFSFKMKRPSLFFNNNESKHQ